MKHPDWSLDELQSACLSSSHRSEAGQKKISHFLSNVRVALDIPSTHRIAIVPGSATGAMEVLLWSLLGAFGVDVWSWEVFGRLWAHDVEKQLKIKKVTHHEASFGQLPDFQQACPQRDQVFVWCGTTSGVWLSEFFETALAPIFQDRKGLTLCDATSAVFATPLPWPLLDATAFSWQKALGGEAAHGMVVLGPRAIDRLQHFTPTWPIPRLFRLTENGQFNEGIFEGKTINTVSLLCVEDALSALRWVKKVGALPGCVRRTQENFSALESWVSQTDWVDFVAEKPIFRSQTAVCLKITAAFFQNFSTMQQRNFLNHMGQILSAQGAAFDVVNHPLVPPSLRVWCGPTVNAEDIKALGPWLDWAYTQSSRHA